MLNSIGGVLWEEGLLWLPLVVGGVLDSPLALDFWIFGYLCECGICVAIWLVMGIAYGILGCVVVI